GPPHLRGARPVLGPAVRHRRAVQLDPPAGDPSMSVWLDPDPLQRTWRSPRRGPRVGRVLLALLLVLVLVGGMLWAVGGLEARDGDRIGVEPGVLLGGGPFQLSCDAARAWEVQFGDEPRENWKIRVYGFGRTTGDRSRGLVSGETAIGRLGSGTAEDA